MRPTTRPSDPSSDSIEDIAANWLTRRDAGWTEIERQECETWLNADARHAAAWELMEEAWVVCDHPRRVGAANAMIAELNARGRRRHWRRFAGLGGCLMAAGLVILFFVSRPANAPTTAAVLARPEKQVLPDGSRVELNSGAQIDVNYSLTRRDVRLVRGEAHFAVVKDATRPFVVSAGALEVRAVGTAFVVKLESQAVDVLVTEGRVAVDRLEPVAPTSPATTEGTVPALVVDAGNRLWAPAAATPSTPPRVETLPALEIERRLAWRGPRLELSNTPLAEAVAVLNRENRIRIVIRDASLGEMRLSGVVRCENPEDFVRLLESNYNVMVDRRVPEEVVLHR